MVEVAPSGGFVMGAAMATPVAATSETSWGMLAAIVAVMSEMSLGVIASE